MIADDLVRKIKDSAWSDEQVAVRDQSGRVYQIAEIEREAQSDDGEGHATSTGATLWLTVEET